MLVRTKNSILFMLLIGLVIASAQLAAQERATAVADGYGETIDKAVQNSAKNALIQLAGTFIDVETSIESRREIRGAIEETYKSFSERSSEYSQGSVESLEVLSTEQDGATYIVTSKVTVRLEKFKNYIRSTALAEAEVSVNLFAEVQQKKRQNENLGDIVVGRLINDIFNLEVVNLEVGAVGAISDPVLEAQARQVLSPTSREVLLSVPVLAQIDPAFLGNAMSTLEKTASIGRTGRGIGPYCESARDDPTFLVVFAELAGSYGRFQRGTKPDDIWGSRCWLNYKIGKFRILNPDQTRLFGFPPDRVNDLCAAAEAIIPRDSRGYYERPSLALHTPSLSVRILDEEQKVVAETLLVAESPKFHDFPVRSSRAFVLGEWHKEHNTPTRNAKKALTFLNYEREQDDGVNKCVFTVNTASSFRVIIKVTDEELAEARSIQIALQR